MSQFSLFTSACVGLATVLVGKWWWKRRKERLMGLDKRTLKIIVVGSTKGIGKAIAVKHIAVGDEVCISGRNQDVVDRCRGEIGAKSGFAVDVKDMKSVEKFVQLALQSLGGHCDAFIINAGVSQDPLGPVKNTPPDTLADVVETNLRGTLFAVHFAWKEMAKNGGGTIFLMEGAGSQGMTTARFAAYGSTKAGIGQLFHSLHRETKLLKDDAIRVCALSPGMVATDLLCKRSASGQMSVDPGSAKIFNILTETPETSADFLVPCIRRASIGKENGKAFRFLTKSGAGWRFVKSIFGVYRNRLFDEKTGVMIQ